MPLSWLAEGVARRRPIRDTFPRPCFCTLRVQSSPRISGALDARRRCFSAWSPRSTPATTGGGTTGYPCEAGGAVVPAVLLAAGDRHGGSRPVRRAPARGRGNPLCGGGKTLVHRQTSFSVVKTSSYIPPFPVTAVGSMQARLLFSSLGIGTLSHHQTHDASCMYSTRSIQETQWVGTSCTTHPSHDAVAHTFHVWGV